MGTHFVKTTALPMEVTRGPVGTKITLHLKGVGWTETSAFRFAFEVTSPTRTPTSSN
jgi:hypothetical protein